LTILPASPLPLTLLISIPFSAANFFASGEAFILPFSVEEVAGCSAP